ncbi:acyl carrier protein [Nocardia transvalensis]|uniref:acyl carrier protein n=1 Tax=Nocardia transvalensis TaxID=37333 RepID=UPI0018945A00|nr:acyl carrier protein [Nocardia transvalensis]MBF6328254.1 acyl carrier protein [Nocardia transvalensis]
MTKITMADIERILVACAGSEEDIDTSVGFAERSFEEMGYDSLALMESAAVIKQEYGITIPDEDLVDVETPKALLELVEAAAAARTL